MKKFRFGKIGRHFKNYIGFMDPNSLFEFSWAETHTGSTQC